MAEVAQQVLGHLQHVVGVARAKEEVGARQEWQAQRAVRLAQRLVQRVEARVPQLEPCVGARELAEVALEADEPSVTTDDDGQFVWLISDDNFKRMGPQRTLLLMFELADD